jgi:small-conductance mechanosensitive channel
MHFAAAAINQIGLKKSVSNYRSKYVIKIVNMTLIAFHLIVLVSYLGIEYSQVSFFLSSIFAVIGVALFANWSILSNITASLIIFFGFPYRVGDNIRIADKDDEISGIIEEISMFHVLIRRDDDLITYPNTLILQKAVIKRPSDTPFTSAKKVDKEQPPAAD